MAEAKGKLQRLWLSLQVGLSAWTSCGRCDVHLNFIGGEPPREHEPGILLACCDEIYYRKFARALVETAKRHSPRQHVHVHVYEPTDAWKAEAKALVGEYRGLTVSWEDSRRNPYRSEDRNYIYFAAARFAVVRQLVEQFQSPILVVDTDGLVVRSLDEPFASFAGHDVGLIRRRTLKPWKKNLAAALLVQPTPNGIAFIGRVADVLQMVLARKPDFHVDQLVVHSVDRAFRLSSKSLRVFPLTRVLADWELRPDTYIWSAKGERKTQFADRARQVMDTPAE